MGGTNSSKTCMPDTHDENLLIILTAAFSRHGQDASGEVSKLRRMVSRIDMPGG